MGLLLYKRGDGVRVGFERRQNLVRLVPTMRQPRALYITGL